MRKASSASIVTLLFIAWNGKSLAATPGVDVQSLIDARDFLEGYRIADAGDAPLFDLYSDHALVHIRVQGQPQAFSLQGRAFKQWRQEQARIGQPRLQGSVFQAARVERRGEKLLIRARRYSGTYCYWDEDYRVTIAKEGLNERIVDEHLTLQPTSHCQISPQVQAPNTALVTASPSWNSPSTPNAAVPWRPLSHDEIAAMAIRMARDTAAKTRASAQVGAPSSAAPASPDTKPSTPLAKSAVRVDPADAE
jgi:hypothetical protein